jgi:hypothetical protein
MRVESVHILNFRSLRDVELSLDDVTILVGANGAGKSSVLHALAWFFAGGALTPEDVSGHRADEQISVTVKFAGLDEDDRVTLGAFVSGDHATFWRAWSTATGEQLTGEALAYAGFASIRDEEGALAKRSVYNVIRQEHPEFQLPSVRSAAAVDAALADWESAHPDQLSASRIDARRIFGGATHDARLDFVLVPAVSDPEARPATPAARCCDSCSTARSATRA